MSAYVNLAYDYPVLGAFWTILWIFLWVLWVMLLFRVIGDIFRDDQLGGWGKAAWLLFTVFLPFLGVFVYVLARGREMGDREIRHAQAQRRAFDEYVREAAAGPGSTSAADELAKLSDLRAKGDISDLEFQRAKEKILH
ncbi:SHOCT domain-containing protein [Streptomyces hesseae]|uniref:SHOCT domain-containing protein n=1 Tax=Streptomyces hesseae TaxID=3075519 RepID=A0ABU2SUJ1_9ACTN|nr:SHOCT domain-containing protein [Streptomyces sp. DSM 40473]MDT0452666.1 SHOCT domain-containing protein [Streptomyces sp. DSM 40473]